MYDKITLVCVAYLEFWLVYLTKRNKPIQVHFRKNIDHKMGAKEQKLIDPRSLLHIYMYPSVTAINLKLVTFYSPLWKCSNIFTQCIVLFLFRGCDLEAAVKQLSFDTAPADWSLAFLISKFV